MTGLSIANTIGMSCNINRTFIHIFGITIGGSTTPT